MVYMQIETDFPDEISQILAFINLTKNVIIENKTKNNSEVIVLKLEDINKLIKEK